MKHLFLILVFVGLLSCVSKQQKFIQAEFDSIEGDWKIQSISYSGTIPDSLKTFFKSGELVFSKCVYKQKDFSVCGGEFALNDFIFDNTYDYNYSLKTFNFHQLGTYGNNPSNLMVNTVIKGSLLFSGDWEMKIVDTNTLMAKQINNAGNIGGLVSYIAVRK